MSSFNTQGSMAGSPYLGLIKAPQNPITPFIPGTQKPAPTPWNNTISGSEVPGTPTASGNANLEGADYFKGLLNSSNPSERQAGQTWLSHQTTPGLLPQHPVKSIEMGADGSTKHTFDTSGDTSKTTGIDSKTTDTSSSNKPILPTAGTTGTDRANAVIQSAQDTPEIQYYKDQAEKMRNAQSYGQVAPYAEAGAYNATTGVLPDLTRPDLAGRAPGTQGLYSNLAGIGSLTAQTGLQNALTDRSQQIGAAENVLGAGAPSGNIINVDPFTGKPVNGGSLTDLAKTAGTISGTESGSAGLASNYQSGLATLKAADGIQSQIVSTLASNPTLNSTPISAITNLKELLSGQTSAPGQQLLAQQIKSYIDTLGIDPATAVSIAQQQQGTLAQLLDSLRKIAATKVEANNPNNSSSSSSGGSTGGTSTYTNGGAF